VAKRSELVFGDEILEGCRVLLVENVRKLLSGRWIGGQLRDRLSERRYLRHGNVGGGQTAEGDALQDTLFAGEPAAKLFAKERGSESG
jgi:hypothetical protein